MCKLWCFNVDTNIIFPKPEYYINYKGLEFKYISRYKEGKADNLVARFSRMSDNEAYRLISEYLNALAFDHDAFMNFSSVAQHENGYDLRPIKYACDTVRSYDCFTTIPEICFISHIENQDQAQLISLYVQAKSNVNQYFKVLFYWHALVYPYNNEDMAIDYINKNKNRTEKLYTNFVEKNPQFSKNNKIETSLGEYIQQGIRHSIAHIRRDKPNSVSLDLENWGQIVHVGTVAAILEDLARHRIETEFNLKRVPPMDVLHEFNPDENFLPHQAIS